MEAAEGQERRSCRDRLMKRCTMIKRSGGLMTGVCGWAAVVSLILAGTAVPAADSASGWLTGTVFESQLAAPVGVLWQNAPLRGAIRGLADARRVAVLLDRRIDPDQKISDKFEDVPLEDLLDQLATERGFAATVLGPIVYLGPADASAKLRTLALLRREEAGKLPREAARRFSQLRQLAWPDFATPRQLLSELVEKEGLRVAGLDQVPHDLWAAADLAPLSLTDRLTLVAIQFDLTFEISGNGTALRLVRVPDDVAIVREYPGGRDPEGMTAKWAEMLPQCKFRVVADKILVRGAVEDHDQIVATRTPRSAASRPKNAGSRKPAASPLAETRFTVKETRAPLGALLRDLARQRGLELRLDEEAFARAGISLQQVVTFSVTDGTEDDLFRAICSPAGCVFKRQGKMIEVRPGASRE